MRVHYGLGCPACPRWVQVSDEDPDASLSTLYNHLYWDHTIPDRDRAHQLLAHAVPLTPALALKRGKELYG